MHQNRKPFFVELPLELHRALIEFTFRRYQMTGRRHTQREVVIDALRKHLAGGTESAGAGRDA